MTIKVYKVGGIVDEHPNAHITWESYDEGNGWRINAIDNNGIHSTGFIYPSECERIEITHEESDKIYAPKPSKPVSKGIIRIIAERERQIDEEGFTADHDDQWKNSELSDAAQCYCMKPPNYKDGDEEVVPSEWPWDEKWWKPTPNNRIRELEKSGALIAAEIDRLLRLKEARDEAGKEVQ
jgi:hypothetical protein